MDRWLPVEQFVAPYSDTDCELERTAPQELKRRVGQADTGDHLIERQAEVMQVQVVVAVSLHDPEGTYLYASDVFTDAFGWEADQLVDRNCYLLFHPDDIPDIQASRMTPEGNIVAVTRQIADRRSLLQALDNERMVTERLSEIDRERQAFLTASRTMPAIPSPSSPASPSYYRLGRVVDEDAARSIYVEEPPSGWFSPLGTGLTLGTGAPQHRAPENAADHPRGARGPSGNRRKARLRRRVCVVTTVGDPSITLMWMRWAST